MQKYSYVQKAEMDVTAVFCTHL